MRVVCGSDGRFRKLRLCGYPGGEQGPSPGPQTTYVVFELRSEKKQTCSKASDGRLSQMAKHKYSHAPGRISLCNDDACHGSRKQSASKFGKRVEERVVQESQKIRPHPARHWTTLDATNTTRHDHVTSCLTVIACEERLSRGPTQQSTTHAARDPAALLPDGRDKKSKNTSDKKSLLFRAIALATGEVASARRLRRTCVPEKQKKETTHLARLPGKHGFGQSVRTRQRQRSPACLGSMAVPANRPAKREDAQPPHEDNAPQT